MAPGRPDTPTPALALSLFGTFDARLNGEPIPGLRMRKGHWLLALLVLYHGGPVQREWVAGKFWPDSDPDKALGNLRMTLKHLRATLGPEGARIRSTRETLALDLSGIAVDVTAFDEAIARGDPASLQEAVALRRQPLLADWLEEWVPEERDRREQEYLSALETLARQTQERGEDRASESYLRLILAVDPTRGESVRALLENLRRRHQYGTATQVYRDHRLRLEQEYQLEPEPETTARYQQIRAEARQTVPAPIPDEPPSRPPSPPVAVARTETTENTYTFLFTDVEGSTRLWEQYPEAMRSALARHDALLREVIAAHDGEVFKTGGDGFCAVFTNAPAALAAARDAQALLHSQEWGELHALRVRMALHTGTAQTREGDYFGPPLNRTARLRDAGHGGQVLLSQATHELVRDHLPPSSVLRDLGRHRLKDLQRDEQIFQLVAQGLPADFPPLRTLEEGLHNLPFQLTSFIGRASEIAAVRSTLSTSRLVTLTGAGGCGKTRLALQVAADRLGEHADGVWLVELGALSEPARVPQQVATALGVREAGGAGGASWGPGPGGRPLEETLIGFLQPRQLLLILDSCEHLVEAVARLVAELLRRCPKLTVLATSEGPLSIYGEQTWRVPSLPVPDPQRLPAGEAGRVESLARYEGVRLFVDRAYLRQPRFAVTERNAPAVAEICYRLDGMPLALELAAAQVRALPVETIAMRLDDRFRLLKGGDRTALPRQQTLRGTIDWSYDLLSPQARVLLRRVSVFAGGWILEAAEAICAGEAIEAVEIVDLLTALVEQSFVQYEDPEGAGRYRLSETIRQYGAEKLAAAGEEAMLRERHRDWYLSLAEEAQPRLGGPQQGEWLCRLEAENENLRGALAWCTQRGEGEAGLRLGGALWRFWVGRGYLGEGRERLAGVLGLPGAEAPTAERAKVLNGAGALAYRQGDYERARVLFEESVVISRQLGDPQSIAGPLHNLAGVAWNQGQYERARALYEESLGIFRQLGDQRRIASSLMGLASLSKEQGDLAGARALYQEGLGVFRQLGDQQNVAHALNGLGSVAYSQGEYEEARALFDESLKIKRQLGDQWGIAHSLWGLGSVASSQEDYERAQSLYGESLEIFRRLENRQGIAYSLEGLAALADARGQPDRAARLFGAAEALREAIGAPLPPDERADYDRHVAAVRAPLDEAVFAAEWAAGRALPLEQAIILGLYGSTPPGKE